MRVHLNSPLIEHSRQLRHNLTDAERKLWSVLRSRNIANAKFRRQHPLGNYILDFYCHEFRIAIELDGGQHYTEEGKKYDNERTEFLNSQGVIVLRLSNIEVLKNIDGVIDALTLTLSQRERELYGDLSQRERELCGDLSQRERELCGDLSQRERELNIEGSALLPPLPQGEGWGEGEKNGFTLIEIIMVIILLGIIAAVAVPRFIDFSMPAKENVTKQKMEVLRKAIVGDPSAVAAGTYSSRGYRGDVGSMPSALSLLTSHNVTWNRYTKTGYNGPYIDAGSGEPFRDAWGNDLVYDSSATPPTITSYGPNGASGGWDDIVVELRY